MVLAEAKSNRSSEQPELGGQGQPKPLCKGLLVESSHSSLTLVLKSVPFVLSRMPLTFLLAASKTIT